MKWSSTWHEFLQTSKIMCKWMCTGFKQAQVYEVHNYRWPCCSLLKEVRLKFHVAMVASQMPLWSSHVRQKGNRPLFFSYLWTLGFYLTVIVNNCSQSSPPLNCQICFKPSQPQGMTTSYGSIFHKHICKEFSLPQTSIAKHVTGHMICDMLLVSSASMLSVLPLSALSLMEWGIRTILISKTEFWIDKASRNFTAMGYLKVP